MKSPERLKDFEDGSPAPIPPLDYSTELVRGQTWVWYNGGWWMPETLPNSARIEYLRREYSLNLSAITTPRQ